MKRCRSHVNKQSSWSIISNTYLWELNKHFWGLRTVAAWLRLSFSPSFSLENTEMMWCDQLLLTAVRRGHFCHQNNFISFWMFLHEHSFPGKLFFKTLLLQRGNHISAVKAADKFTTLRIINVPADDSRCVQCPGYGWDSHTLVHQAAKWWNSNKGERRDTEENPEMCWTFTALYKWKARVLWLLPCDGCQGDGNTSSSLTINLLSCSI